MGNDATKKYQRPYDLILSNSKIRALERRETTGRHEFTARRLAELSLGARHAGRGFEPSLPRVATPGPRRTPCVKYDSCAIIYLLETFSVAVLLPRVPRCMRDRARGQTRLGSDELHTDLQLQATGRDLLRRGSAGPEIVHLTLFRNLCAAHVSGK